jgi:hypothetical protein
MLLLRCIRVSLPALGVGVRSLACFDFHFFVEVPGYEFVDMQTCETPVIPERLETTQLTGVSPAFHS